MKIIKYKKKNSNQYTVMLSDNTSLSFYDDTIIYYNLLGKKEIDEKLLKEIIEYNNNYEAYYKALKSITTKLRTEKELETKLKKNNYTSKNISFAINKLKEQGYINNDLYLKSYITDQINLSLKGPNKISFELKKLGFDDNDINKYLEDYDKELWTERIEKIITKKEKSNHNLSVIMLKNKIKKDLVNLGYEMNLIDSYINSHSFKESDSILEKEFNKELRKLNRKYSGDELKYKLRGNLYKKGFDFTSIDRLIGNKLD